MNVGVHGTLSSGAWESAPTRVTKLVFMTQIHRYFDGSLVMRHTLYEPCTVGLPCRFTLLDGYAIVVV